jgi:hypothetical protein
MADPFPYRGAPPSPEAIRANEELLERMLQTDSRSFDPKLRVLSGKIVPPPSNHFDPRMNLCLGDMASCYSPPYAPIKVYPEIVIKRMHKTQAETEKDLKSS